MNKRLSDTFYTQVVDALPLLCVDLLVVWQGKYVLVKRKNKPAKGLWWPPGGRVWKGESIEKAALRKAKEELGIKVKVLAPAGYMEYQSKDSAWGPSIGTHSVSIVVLVSPLSLDIRLDKQSSAWKLSANLPEKFIVKPFGVFKN